MDTDKHRENTSEDTKTVIEEKPNIKSKLNKNGEPRKQLSDADKARRAEILAEGRRKALEKRKQLVEMKKTPPVTKPIPDPEPEPVPEPDVGEDKESDDETVQVVRRVKSKPKKKTKQKIIIMNESDSSSDEEVIVKKKKKKKPTPPPTPPPQPVAVQRRPSIPQMSEEDMERIRRDKIRRYTEKKKQEKLMESIFG